MEANTSKTKGKDEKRKVENTSMLTLLASVQVHCKICKRNAASDDSLVQRLKTGTQFTHHQKSVILDAAGLEGGPQVDQDLDSGKHPTIITTVVFAIHDRKCSYHNCWLSILHGYAQQVPCIGMACRKSSLSVLHVAAILIIRHDYCGDAGSPRGLSGDGKRNWTKNKLERFRRRSPGHNSPAAHAKPDPRANMGDETTKRRLIAFIGGLDLCNGRYDTPRHSLFHTLHTVHTQDFYQACIDGADLKKGGERGLRTKDDAKLQEATAMGVV